MDVLTIGSAVFDVFLHTPDLPDTPIGCFPMGQKIEVSSMEHATGGGATNAAVTFIRWGFKTGVAGHLGKDLFAEEIVRELKQEHVDLSLLSQHEDEQTGYSTLLVAPDGERVALVHRGVSAVWAKAPSIPKVKGLYITSLGGNMGVLEDIVHQGAAHGSFITLNPGQGELKEQDQLKQLLRSVSLLLMNADEAQQLLGSREGSAKQLAHHLGELVPAVVVTDGANGAYGVQHQIPAATGTRGTPSRSRTGAGDAFGSGVTAALLSGLPFAEAMRAGTCNAEHVIRYVGAKRGILRGLPDADERATVPLLP